MTRKDYELIAETISEAQLPDESYRYTLAKEFAWALAHTNPKFNRARFIRAAAGVDE